MRIAAPFLVTLVCSLSLASAAPAETPDSTRKIEPPPSPTRAMRLKLSAGDLPSAESILEMHQQAHGEDKGFVYGLGWLARGAWMLGEDAKAERYCRSVRDLYAARASREEDVLAEDHALELALGAALETEAQRIRSTQSEQAAVTHLERALAEFKGPVAFRSRLHKRMNMMAMEGSPAPELALEDFIGDDPPLLAALRGKPVVLFLWASWCGDCKAQAPGLARARRLHAEDDVQFVAVTRYYEEAPERPAEKARADSVWQAVYAEVGDIPSVISTASMERYGGSSTPTFVFIDRHGIVRRYMPTRLTEAAFDEALALIR